MNNDSDIIVNAQPIEVMGIMVYSLSGYRWSLITLLDLIPVKTPEQASTLVYIFTHDRLEIAMNIEKLVDVSSAYAESIDGVPYNEILNVVSRRLVELTEANRGVTSKKKHALMDRLRHILVNVCQSYIYRQQIRWTRQCR